MASVLRFIYANLLHVLYTHALSSPFLLVLTCPGALKCGVATTAGGEAKLISASGPPASCRPLEHRAARPPIAIQEDSVGMLPCVARP
ncbi:hypothetical protein E2C01_101275 [Portunus trituberculatus]|uniref:Secreted protein n=1 Tax=Portunus trituberculatus TaxID=210409 RepID=A0A5B7KFP1_PORTR|nr:hypothetical protein [Portunus trituberculatus]